jgi:uncharacterized membrane protein
LLFGLLFFIPFAKAVAALEQYGGTEINTSLSDEDTKRLQEALQRPTPPTSPDDTKH